MLKILLTYSRISFVATLFGLQGLSAQDLVEIELRAVEEELH